jgi:glycosyltransferase involved in cell wall biosynthesis
MNVGGTARYVGELVEKIPNSKLAMGYVQGSEIEDPSVEKFDPIRIKYLGRKLSLINDFRAWSELRKIVKELEPEVVHTHTFKAGLIGRLVGGNHKRVHTYHGHLFADHSFSGFELVLIKIVEKFLARRTNILISVGKKVGDELRSEGIGKRCNWLSIAPGVSALRVFERGQARRYLKIHSNEILIGWMARMEEVKNPFLLLEIALRLPDSNFVMAGGGEMLKKVKVNAPKNVKVIGWADAAKFWSAVDCAISTSNNEGMPIALIEAQLAGVPVVATNVGSTSEVIENGVTGLITSSSSKELGEAVTSLTLNPLLMKSMGKAARQKASKEFSLENMIRSHTEVYTQLTR